MTGFLDYENVGLTLLIDVCHHAVVHSVDPQSQITCH